MLKVGINTKVLLAGAAINDKGSLVVSFKDGNAPAPVVSAEDDLLNQTAGVKASDGLTNIIVWNVKVEDNGQTKEPKAIADGLRVVRDQLEHLLLGYVTSDRAQLKPYEGIDTSGATSPSFWSQNIVDKIYNNLATQFVAKITELKDQVEVKTFRLLLIRRSAANHYGIFRKNFISDNPFWEDETIPESASRLRFTKWEVEKGFSSGEPVAKASVADVVTAGATSATDDILGSR